MEERRASWRLHLMGNKMGRQRELYHRFIQGSNTVSDTTTATICADMPRTYPNIPEIQQHLPKIQELLISYASFQKGDAYLQGFNYTMTILWMTFHGTEHAEADTWWCFSAIVARIRPLMPDFNVTWFHWLRRHWMEDFHNRLAAKRPTLNGILQHEPDTWSSLITIKWFMLWFAQTVQYKEIFKLWDFLIQLPPQKLMYAYTAITFEILCEIAPEITYQWTQRPTNIMHMLLNVKVDGISNALNRVKETI